jgi:hypothetical protein
MQDFKGKKVSSRPSASKHWGKKELLSSKKPTQAKTRSSRSAFADISNKRQKMTKKIKTVENPHDSESFPGSTGYRSVQSSAPPPLLHPFHSFGHILPAGIEATALGYDSTFSSPFKFSMDLSPIRPSPTFRKDGDYSFVPIESQSDSKENWSSRSANFISRPSVSAANLKKPTAVRVSFAGKAAHFSPLNPVPLTTHTARMSQDKNNEVTPLVHSHAETPVIRNPRIDLTTATSKAAAVVSQSKSEFSADYSPSKLTSLFDASPSCFEPAPTGGQSKHRSPSDLKHFLGWTSELTQALDLNECLEDCKKEKSQ